MWGCRFRSKPALSITTSELQIGENQKECVIRGQDVHAADVCRKLVYDVYTVVCVNQVECRGKKALGTNGAPVTVDSFRMLLK